MALTMASIYSRALDERERLARALALPDLQHLLREYDPERLAASSLARAEAGYVSRPVCELLEQAARDIPDVTLSPEQLLAPDAFLLLASPLRFPGGFTAGSLSWTTRPGLAFDHDGPATALIAWMQPGGLADVARTVPMPIAAWPHGLRISEAVSAFEGVDTIGTSPEDRLDLPAMRWLAALNAFCDQKLITGSRAPAERATRRRLERAGRESSDVLVVELRRVEQKSPDPGGEGREWSCSWTVSGHWRRQYFPSINDHRAIWIAPHIKGDPAKPLRVRKRVFAIVH